MNTKETRKPRKSSKPINPNDVLPSLICMHSVLDKVLSKRKEYDMTETVSYYILNKSGNAIPSSVISISQTTLSEHRHMLMTYYFPAMFVLISSMVSNSRNPYEEFMNILESFIDYIMKISFPVLTEGILAQDIANDIVDNIVVRNCGNDPFILELKKHRFSKKNTND